MKHAKAVLEKKGHAVLLPESAEKGQTKEWWEVLKADAAGFSRVKGERIKGHFNKIKESDAVLVLNHDKNGKKAHIGPNTSWRWR